MIVGSALGNVELRATSFEDPNVRLTAEQLVASLGLDQASYTGKTITPSSALTGTVAVYACTSLIAESISSLPMQTYERIDDLRREPVSRSGSGWQPRLARMLHSAPNPEMTAQEMWENYVGHFLLWGNAYLNVVRARDGRPAQLWPLRPDKMEVGRDSVTREKFYRYTLPSGERKDLLSSEVLHVKGLSLDGMTGLSRIQAGTNAIGMEQAGAEYAGRFFANSAVPAGYLQLPDTTKNPTETAKLIRDDWQSKQGGLSHAQRVGILYGGASWSASGMPLRDAQFLEQRSFQIVEVARLFRVPLHMIQETTKDTGWGSGIEVQALGFLTFTCRPIMEKIEGAIDLNLGLTPGSKLLSDDGYYAEFDPAGMLRTDSKAQAETFEVYIRNRVMNPQQVAGKLNLPYDPERPTIYENPNTTPGDQAP